MNVDLPGVAQEQWLSLALDAANLCAYRWDLGANRIYRAGNSAWETRTDPAREEWLFDEALSNVHREDQGRVQEHVRAAIETREGFDFEFRVIDHEGETRWLRSKGRVISDDQFSAPQIYCITQEVTAQKLTSLRLAQQAEDLALSKHQLETALELANMVVVSLKPGAMVFEPKLNRIFGFADETQGLTREDLFSRVHPEDIARVRDSIDEVSRTGGYIEHEYRVVLPDGRQRWLLVKGSICLKTGRRYLVIQDVTHGKRLGLELERRYEDLRAINAKLERFSAVAAHDLKNPLASLVMGLELMDAGEENAGVRRLRSLALRMSSLIDELLEFARSKGDEAEAHETVSLDALLEITRENLAAAIAAHGASLEISGPLPDVTGRPRQLQQLFQNLVSNGLKFRSERTPALRIGYEVLADAFKFCVEDNGVGMDTAQVQRAFEPFRRFQPNVEGHGLGLAICKNIVEAHGGRIWIESIPARGSRFYFTLPRSGAAAV